MKIIDHIQDHVTLRKAGAHYVGPCPKCGGSSLTTRFVVNVAKDFAQCYSCGGNWDVIRFLREIEGLSCPQAHRKAGKECDNHSCPVWSKCSLHKGNTAPRHTTAATPTIPAAQSTSFQASQPENPAEIWRQHAGAFVDLCHQRLLDCPEQLDYLASRGLPRAAVEKYRLGWIPKIEFKTRSAWGLADKWNEKESRAIKSLPFPQGILIPWIVGGHVHRLRLRKSVVTGPNDPRYLWIDGSGTDIICLNHAATAHVVVESDLDGLLVDWIAGDAVGAIPLGSCSTKPKAAVMALLRSSLRILVSLDYDHEQRDERLHAPGAKAAHWWYREFPDTAKRWPVPKGKDPGEAHAVGCDLRSWVLNGLPVALQARFRSAPVVMEVVEPIQAEEIKLCSDVHRIDLPDGPALFITDNPSEYARLVAEGSIVFDFREYELVKQSGANKQQAAVFLNLKQVFPGIRLTEVTPYQKETTNARPEYRGKYYSAK